MADGQYAYVHEQITTQRFPREDKSGVVQLDIVMMQFDARTTVGEIVRRIAEMGYRPITIREMLAFGAMHKDVQRRYPIIVLGSYFDDPHYGRIIPYLWVTSEGKRLAWLTHGNNGDRPNSQCRFAVVKK